MVITDREGNDAQRYVKLKGLDAKAYYQIEGLEGRYSGAVLMNAGIPVPNDLNEYEGTVVCLDMINPCGQ